MQKINEQSVCKDVKFRLLPSIGLFCDITINKETFFLKLLQRSLKNIYVTTYHLRCFAENQFNIKV